jgi:UDP-glucose 4-epimerase
MMHLAAQMDVRKSVADPAFDADVNVRGLLNLMEAGRRGGLSKVVFSSTGGAIYGEPVVAPQAEDHPLRPLSPYGIAKLTSEYYLHFYRHVYDIEFVALRYGNVYGPRQNPHGEAGVVAIFAERMLADQPVFINGSGRQTRDYVFVDDVVRANLLALEYGHSGVFNVGTGVETSVNDLFTVIRDAIDPGIEMRYREAQPGEQMRSVLDISAAARHLGWSPEHGLTQGLQETVDWFRNRKG